MISDRFKSMTNHAQSWILSMIPVWDDFDKCTELFLRYVGSPRRLKFVQGGADTFIIAQFEDRTLIPFCPTKNFIAWISDFTAFTITGKFHPGIKRDVEEQFLPYVKEIENRTVPIMLQGHSKGGANALYANLCLRRLQFPDVESWAFDSPFIATDRGIYEMAGHGVRNTNFLSEPFSDDLPSSPVDNVGVFNLYGWGEQYGQDHKLLGNASLADHSHLNGTLRLAAWLENEGYSSDAKYLLSLVYKTGDSRIIKK